MERNQERKERNKKRTQTRKAGGAHASDSDLSDPSGDRDHIARTRPGTGRQSDNLRIDGGFPTCRNITDWAIYVANQCYNSTGYTDRLEYAWLVRVLKISDERSNSLLIVPDEMADLDKLLLRALRREDRLPKDLARDIMKLEKQLLAPKTTEDSHRSAYLLFGPPTNSDDADLLLADFSSTTLGVRMEG
jgi:hypothetical protein